MRKPEPLSSVRAKSLNSQTTGESFIQLYEIYCKYDLFKHPECIHNMDESHCSFQHKPTKVLANYTFWNTPGRVSDSREGTTFITHGHGGRERGGRGSQSQSRLLTSDEIYQFKQEQEKVKEEKKKKALERKQEKVEYHLKQLAKLQK